MQSVPLEIEPARATRPRTVWCTPQGLPCFSAPSPGRLLWLRVRRMVARWRRVRR